MWGATRNLKPSSHQASSRHLKPKVRTHNQTQGSQESIRREADHEHVPSVWTDTRTCCLLSIGHTHQGALRTVLGTQSGVSEQKPPHGNPTGPPGTGKIPKANSTGWVGIWSSTGIRGRGWWGHENVRPPRQTAGKLLKESHVHLCPEPPPAVHPREMQTYIHKNTPHPREPKPGHDRGVHPRVNGHTTPRDVRIHTREH